MAIDAAQLQRTVIQEQNAVFYDKAPQCNPFTDAFAVRFDQQCVQGRLFIVLEYRSLDREMNAFCARRSCQFDAIR